MIIAKWLRLNKHLLKCLILGFLIPISLFANDDKPKSRKDNRKNVDTTVLLGNPYEHAGIRFKEDSLFTPEQMREDLLFFYDKVLKTHPNPYHIISKDSLDKNVEVLLKSLDKPLNRREFWLKIATLNACFDGHTEFLIIGEIFDYFWANSKPQISWNLSNSMIMSDSLRNFYFNPAYSDSLLAGKHIKSINDIPANQIVDKISTYYSHENKKALPQSFSSRFFLLYPNIFGRVDSFRFEYINNNEVTVRTFTSNDTALLTQMKQHKSIFEGKNFVRFNFYEDSIAIIELNSFNPDDLDKNYRKDLEKIMNTVVKKNIKHLFIDISANGGGSEDCAFEILNFIKTEKKKYYIGSSEIKISPAYRAGMQRSSLPDGSMIKRDWNWRKNNSKIQYNQNFYLMQSTMGTHSASVSLASLVKAYKLGTIIGEETGGLTGCYINCVFWAMPNTSIPFMCSVQKSIDVGGAMDGRGVLPDIEYKMKNPYKIFTLEQLKEMLRMVKGE